MEWMASSRLRLNSAKTELIWLGASRYAQRCPPGPQLIAGSLITPSLNIRDLGAIIDSNLSLAAHVNHVSSVCYYHIRQLRLVRRSLTLDAAHSLVRALIHSRLEYCNGILANAPAALINSLQSVLRSAARLVLRLPARASVTQPMRDILHWLPVQQRIKFKLCTLAFKCTRGVAPPYLSRLCTRVSSIPSRDRLRSAAAGRLVVPAVNMTTVGQRGFYYACPAVWNALPSKLTADVGLSIMSFKKQLKTVLFV